MLRKYDGLVDILHVSSSMSRDEYGKDTRFMLTEKEIKDYDKRFWPFAVKNRGARRMNSTKKLQVRIDEYAFGVWFDTVDIDPYSQTVRIYNHLFDKEQTFSDADKKMIYREVEVME